jgi:uncharacterized membrane protein YphA (DoxX/SURF4 family)
MPFQLFAHEVYVLSPDKIDRGMTDHSINIFNALSSSHNMFLFFLCAGLGALIVLTAFYLRSITPFVSLGKTIDKSSAWALVVIRVAFGASLLFSAANSSLYGPELPISSFPLSSLLSPIMIIAGIALIVGFSIRLFATLTILIWLLAFASKGFYILTYINYLGEGIALVLLPATKLSIDGLLNKGRSKKYKYEQYSLPTARVLLAFSLLYTAITIKFATPMLTLDVVRDFTLTRYIPFDPLFVVLGAGLIEVLVGILFLAGLMQRFTAVIFLAALTLSVIFFGESVWPHILIIALGLGLFMHKPDKYTLDSWLFAHRLRKSKQIK